MEKNLLQRWFGLAAPVQETTEAMARRGVAEAQFGLGLQHAQGKGAAQDYAQAEHWYLQAAGQNHALAQFNLGIMHAEGQGVPADQSKSLGWMQKAADLGDAGAQYRLGLTHQRAIRDGLPANAAQARIDAYQWLRLAADQGYPEAEAAWVTVNLQMSSAAALEGGRRVATFNESHDRRNQAA